MRTADQWMDAYGESHQHPINKRIHWICVPLIMMSLIGMLWAVALPGAPWLNLGVGLMAFGLVYYWMISKPLALGMAVVTAAMLLGIVLLQQLPIALWKSSVAIFVVAWIGQFIGHKLEGKKPSFFEDLQYLMIGPMWLLGHVFKRNGWSY
jgi:uncharacterized membrane protein YGL010W